jgi:folate-dependent phosphoribosylglycinamide formyltransferase PurN
MSHKKIVLIAGEGISTNIIFNELNKNFDIHTVVLEKKESAKIFLKRRIRRQGLLTVIGQILFQVVIVKLLNLTSRRRQENIMSQYCLDQKSIPDAKIKSVNSINSEDAITTLKNIDPDLIIVNGTRIISKKVLSATNAKFINTHAGITPKYRGVHGGYWALVQNDKENCGVTVHFVDEGVDTGMIIEQDLINPVKEDNFTTYPLLQLAKGIKLLNNAVHDFQENKLVAQQEKKLESMLWYHPTIWAYLYNRILKGVK